MKLEYQDFSSYTHTVNYEVVELKNIGWISPFFIGNRTEPINYELVQKLILLKKNNSFNAVRTLHTCNLCGRDEIYVYIPDKMQDVMHFNSEIWVPSINDPNVTYVSISLIVHYILKHNYVPPQDYIDSVMAFDVNSQWKVEAYATMLFKKYEDKYPDFRCHIIKN